jgi:hypothetical protein
MLDFFAHEYGWSEKEIIAHTWRELNELAESIILRKTASFKESNLVTDDGKEKVQKLLAQGWGGVKT